MSLKSKKLDISVAQKELLALKGIGAKGNREVSGDVIFQVITEIVGGQCSPVFAGVMIASLKVLELTVNEKKHFDDIVNKLRKNMDPIMLKLCFEEFSDCKEDRICKKLFQKNDLSEVDCEFLTKALFDQSIDPIYLGFMLQGLRLKRETVAENCFLKESLSRYMNATQWSGGDLVQLAEPYDGFVRSPYLGFYLATVLSYKGFSSLLHSQKGLGPKYGLTCLDAIEQFVDVDLNTSTALSSLDEIKIAVVDSEKVMSELSELKVIRNQMIKRSYLATFDKLINPVESKNNNIQVCGYVHTPYLNTLSEVLKKDGGQLSILIKGIEGGVVLDPYKNMMVHSLRNGELEQFDCTQMKLDNDFDKDEVCSPHKILCGEHYFSKHIAYTASVLISIMTSSKNCEQELLEIESLFKNGELLKHFYHCINFLKKIRKSLN